MVVMETQNKIGNLEEEALKRKERLKSFKRKTNNSEDTANQPTVTLPKPKFRSYRPQDETLQDHKLKEAEPVAVEEEVKDLIEASTGKIELQELDITSLAPRKPDWDLKRDVAKKLEKLERRTQKAIAELIWERLKQGNEDNLSILVTMNNEKPAQEN